jgi:hypothetical protein
MRFQRNISLLNGRMEAHRGVEFIGQRPAARSGEDGTHIKFKEAIRWISGEGQPMVLGFVISSPDIHDPGPLWRTVSDDHYQVATVPESGCTVTPSTVPSSLPSYSSIGLFRDLGPLGHFWLLQAPTPSSRSLWSSKARGTGEQAWVAR